jgi:exosortase H (IPTLxxWG-CTERM-specific)
VPVVSETDSQASLALAGADGGGEPKGREPWFRFALIFGSLAIASEVFYYAMALDSEGFRAYLGVLAKISAAILSLFESDVVVRGTRISGNSFAIEVAQGCDAIEVCSLLAAAVIAFPIGFKHKLRGLAVGILLLQIFNLLRIITLYWAGSYSTSAFKMAHETVWPGILITITVVIWILWVRWETQAELSVDHAA